MLCDYTGSACGAIIPTLTQNVLLLPSSCHRHETKGMCCDPIPQKIKTYLIYASVLCRYRISSGIIVTEWAQEAEYLRKILSSSNTKIGIARSENAVFFFTFRLLFFVFLLFIVVVTLCLDALENVC